MPKHCSAFRQLGLALVLALLRAYLGGGQVADTDEEEAACTLESRAYALHVLQEHGFQTDQIGIEWNETDLAVNLVIDTTGGAVRYEYMNLLAGDEE